MVKTIHIILSILIITVAALSFFGLSFDVLFDKDFSTLYIYITLPFLVFFLITYLISSKLLSFAKIGLPIVLLVMMGEIIVAAFQEWGAFSGGGFNQMIAGLYIGLLASLLLTTLVLNFIKK